MFSLVRLGDLCELYNGKAFAADDWSMSGLPIIRIQNLKDSNRPFNYWAGSTDRQVIVENGDVLLAWSGTPGTSFGAHIWHGSRSVLNQHIFKVVLDEKRILKRWCVRAINFQLDRLIAQAHGGVGLKHVTRPMVESLALPLPSLDEQRWLSAILDQADDLRRKRRLALDKLNELPQAIFHKMFGDPITNANRYPTVALEELIDDTRGISYGIVQRGFDQSQGVNVLRISDLKEDRIDTAALKKTTAAIAIKHKRTRLHGGEIVISIRGTIGRCAIVPGILSGSNVSRELAVLPLTGPKDSREFVLHLLRTSPVQHRLTRDVKGVAQSGLNLEDLRKLPIIQPPAQLVTTFVALLNGQRALADKTRVHLERCELLFASLQHHAFKGTLTSASVEAMHALV